MAEKRKLVEVATAEAAKPTDDSKVSSAFRASIYPKDSNLPSDFVFLIQELEKLLEMPLWMIIQNDRSEWGNISPEVYYELREVKADIAEGKPVGLLLQSPGGDAESAYKIIRLFQRRSDKFTVVVPCYAKSAATLMACGGKRIIMGREAELGPLDVQMYDQDRGYYDSALNAVQSVERLNASALLALDQAMMLFATKIGKKPETLLPHALSHASNVIRPLLEKIDTVDLTRKSRELKVAEDYAIRLMRGIYSNEVAARIANNLVELYSTHSFAIDRTEATRFDMPSRGKPFGLGLKIEKPKPEVEVVFDKLTPHLEDLTVIGRLTEVKHEAQ